MLEWTGYDVCFLIVTYTNIKIISYASVNFYSYELRFDFRLGFLQSVVHLYLKTLLKNGQTRYLDFVKKRLAVSRSDARKQIFVSL